MTKIEVERSHQTIGDAALELQPIVEPQKIVPPASARCDPKLNLVLQSGENGTFIGESEVSLVGDHGRRNGDREQTKHARRFFHPPLPAGFPNKLIIHPKITKPTT